jgi:histone H3/H4
MLSSDDLYTCSRLCIRILSIYNSNYYRINGYIASEFGQSIMSELVMQESTNVVIEFVQSNKKDASDINDLIRRFNDDIENAGKKVEVNTKLRLTLMKELDKKEQLLAVRNLVAKKTLARFIGQNMQTKLQQKEEYKQNEQASLAKKFVALNKAIRNILTEFQDKSVEELNKYVRNNIDTIVDDAMKLWTDIPECRGAFRF